MNHTKMKLIYCLLFVGLFTSCQSTNQQQSAYSGPLRELFIHWDELSTHEFHIAEKDRNYNLALGLNDQQAIDRAVSDFATAHKGILDAIKQKFPVGTLKLPVEQSDVKLVEVTNLAMADYMFPWNTATRLSFILSFDCKVKNKLPITLVRFEFYDRDNDIIMSSNVAVGQSGKYQFEIRPEVEFYHFTKVIVSAN